MIAVCISLLFHVLPSSTGDGEVFGDRHSCQPCRTTCGSGMHAQDKQKLFRLLKNLNGENKERKPAPPAKQAAGNAPGRLDLAPDALLDLEEHDGDLLAHVRLQQRRFPCTVLLLSLPPCMHMPHTRPSYSALIPHAAATHHHYHHWPLAIDHHWPTHALPP